MAEANKRQIDRCPKPYIKWIFVILGMVFAFVTYLIISNITGDHSSSAAISGDNPEALILTEHINEEGDFEKPVCKRLEGSGERYNQQEMVIDGEI